MMTAGNCRCSAYVLVILAIFLGVGFRAGADDSDIPILRKIRVHSLSDRTAQELEKIENSLRSSHGAERREAMETLESIISKLDEYLQSFENKSVVQDRSFSASLAAEIYRRACETYWQNWKEQIRRGEFASLVFLKKPRPNEAQARKWMAEVRGSSPLLREAVLELTAKENLSPETRATFSSIAIRLFEKDASAQVKAASLRALGRLKQPSAPGLAALKQALTDPRFVKDAAIALAEWGTESRSLSPELRSALETSDFETGAALLNALRVAESQPTADTLALAKDILMDLESEQFPEYRRMQEQAYLILERNYALPDLAPSLFASLAAWDKSRAEALEQAIKGGELPETKRLLKLGAKLNRDSFRPLFRLYCVGGEFAQVRAMISNPDFATIDEYTNLHTTLLTLESGKIDIVKLLIEKVFLADYSIWAVCECASQLDHADVLQFLFEARRNGNLLVERNEDSAHYKAIPLLAWALDHGHATVLEAYLRHASEETLLRLRNGALKKNNQALADWITNWGKKLERGPLQ